MLKPNFLSPNGGLASAILDQMRFPVFLVDRDAAIQYSNVAGLAALKEGESFKRADHLLSTTHPADNARLRAAIEDVCASGERQTLLINDGRSLKPQLVAVVRLADDEPGPRRKTALVFVQRCEPTDETFTSSMRQLFRLSTAETAIATALVSGADVEHVAEMRNARITTVRTQVAAMLLKTRTRRQGELVALLSRICTLP